MKTSVIVAIYNKTDYLELVLAGLSRQSYNDFEVIFADDGSNQESVKRIIELSSEAPFPVLHLWQEDRGFRKNRALNNAVKASGDYLIFIDGDCIPHHKFIEEHVKNANDGVCLTGRRVNLSKKFTRSLTKRQVKEGAPDNMLPGLIIDGVFGKSYDVEKGFYFKNAKLRNYFNQKERGLLGCNFSLYKTDLLDINGFDERYEAPSIGEDSDVEFRLRLNGVKVRSLNNIAVQYHLYHKLQPRLQKNLDIFDKVKSEKKAFTPYGIE